MSTPQKQALNRAFAQLRRSGLLARQAFKCCSTCGHAAMGSAVEHGTATGYVFFHQQDAERLEANPKADLYLRFGSANASPAGDLALGQTIVQAVRAQGLSVTWPKKAEVSIRVHMGIALKGVA